MEENGGVTAMEGGLFVAVCVLSSEQCLARALDMNVVFQNWIDLGKVCLFHSVGAWRGCERGLDLHEHWYQGRMNAALHVWPQSSADLEEYV